MYLSGQESSSYLMKNQFNINGPSLMAFNSSIGLKLYRVKVFEDVSLENNPKFMCKRYLENRDYEKVR